MAASILVCLAALWSALSPAPTSPKLADPRSQFLLRETASHKSVSVSDERAEVDGVELAVKSTKEIAYEEAYRHVEVALAIGGLEARGDAKAEKMTLRYTYFEVTEGDVEFGLDRGENTHTVTLRSKAGDPFVISKVELVVPMKRALALLTTNGTVKLAGYETETTVEIAADNGAVTLDRVTAQKTTVRAENGAVNATEASGDELSIRSRNGSIAARGARVKTLSLVTSNGSVEVSDSACDALVAKTTNGNVTISKTTYATRDVSTVNGRVTED